jgi:predicted protein tyrosine phosphatase
MTAIFQSRLTICGLDELERHRASSVTHVLSILDPAWPEPEAFFAYDPHHRTTLHFHDVIEPLAGMQLPRKEHVADILAFGLAFQREHGGRADAHLLIHCHAGISRSTAAMASLLLQAHPDETEDRIFERLTAIRPQAWPNSLMIGFADEILGREGRFTAALRRLYARRLATKPELATTMRNLHRAREVEMAESAG